jgi:hypothetical protein
VHSTKARWRLHGEHRRNMQNMGGHDKIEFSYSSLNIVEKLLFRTG